MCDDEVTADGRQWTQIIPGTFRGACGDRRGGEGPRLEAGDDVAGLRPWFAPQFRPCYVPSVSLASAGIESHTMAREVRLESMLGANHSRVASLVRSMATTPPRRSAQNHTRKSRCDLTGRIVKSVCLVSVARALTSTSVTSAIRFRGLRHNHGCRTRWVPASHPRPSVGARHTSNTCLLGGLQVGHHLARLFSRKAIAAANGYSSSTVAGGGPPQGREAISASRVGSTVEHPAVKPMTTIARTPQILVGPLISVPWRASRPRRERRYCCHGCHDHHGTAAQCHTCSCRLVCRTNEVID